MLICTSGFRLASSVAPVENSGNVVSREVEDADCVNDLTVAFSTIIDPPIGRRRSIQGKMMKVKEVGHLQQIEMATQTLVYPCYCCCCTTGCSAVRAGAA